MSDKIKNRDNFSRDLQLKKVYKFIKMYFLPKIHFIKQNIPNCYLEKVYHIVSR